MPALTLPWRRLPPVHSPLSATAITKAFVTTLTGTDQRPMLAERLTAAYHAPTVCLTDSGTAALELAIGVARNGDARMAPLAVPAYSCYDVATAAVATDAPLMLYDLDPRTLGPDLASLGRCLAEGARTVVVAPLHGMPVDWDALDHLTRRWGARMVEDAAQGFGAEWRGRSLGSLGEVSVLSFGRGKGWTGGSGGAMLVRGSGRADGHAQSRDFAPFTTELLGLVAATGQWVLGRPGLYALPSRLPWLHLGETRYHDSNGVRPMRRCSAALIVETWADARREARGRREVGARLRAALASRSGVTVIVPPDGGVAGDLRLPMLLKKDVDGLVDSPRARALGLARGYPATLAALPAVRARLVPWCRDRRWRGAEELVERLITAPTHSLVTESDLIAFVRLMGDHSRDLPSVRS